MEEQKKADIIELVVAKGMRDKGYKYVVCFKKYGLTFLPLYVKSANDVGPLLRKEYKDCSIKWSRNIEDYIKELEAV